MPALSLSLGSTVAVYQLNEVLRMMEKAHGANSDAVRRVYQRMLDAGPDRFVSKPSTAAALDPVADECPNFEGVLSDLANYIELALVGKRGLNVMPILLTGDPGVGKTHFAKTLAKALNVPFQFLSMGTMSAGWILGGSAPTWQGAKQGKIAESLIDSEFANPVFLVDELDKTGGDARHDPYGALLQLMEGETARHFKDEYLDVALDASQIFWVATANNAELIPDYIRSRMIQYDVPAPTPGQSRVLAQNIYAGLLAAHDFPFEPVLSDDTQDVLSTVAPREMKKKLLDGLASAIRDKRSVLRPDDIRSSHAKAGKTMGFLASA